MPIKPVEEAVATSGGNARARAAEAAEFVRANPDSALARAFRLYQDNPENYKEALSLIRENREEFRQRYEDYKQFESDRIENIFTSPLSSRLDAIVAWMIRAGQGHFAEDSIITVEGAGSAAKSEEEQAEERADALYAMVEAASVDISNPFDDEEFGKFYALYKESSNEFDEFLDMYLDGDPALMAALGYDSETGEELEDADEYNDSKQEKFTVMAGIMGQRQSIEDPDPNNPVIKGFGSLSPYDDESDPAKPIASTFNGASGAATTDPDKQHVLEVTVYPLRTSVSQTIEQKPSTAGLTPGAGA